MVKPSFSASSYSKRRFFSTNKRKTDMKDLMQQEAQNLPDVINKETCWKAYHLEESACELHFPPNPRTSNCKKNPYCIRRLGLEKLEKLKSQQTDVPCPKLDKRDLEKQPCGLVNNGNYCYVNSFLQIWYNDLEFRQCVYDWRPSPGWAKPEGAMMEAQDVMNCLQKLFISMQLTPFESTNAVELTELLRLGNEQQDVQEFTTLFFDALSQNLTTHPNGAPVRKLIQSRFEIRMIGSMECQGCSHTKENESEYRSLQINIEGFKTLTSAIQGYFAPEELQDYKCEACNQKGKVVRYNRFSHFPPVLVIQLNRHIFNSNGNHKKSKSPLQFPRILPEKTLQGTTEGDRSYELRAVLIHEGQNIQCGHYYDMIKDPVTQQWYTYNDKQVVQSKPPGVAVEKEGVKATEDMKGCYALIYHRPGATNVVPRVPSDEIVTPIIKKLEKEFRIQAKEGDVSAKVWNQVVSQKYTSLSNSLEKLEVHNGKDMRKRASDLAFLPTTLLSDLFMKEFKAVEEMRNLDNYSLSSGNGDNSLTRDDHMSVSDEDCIKTNGSCEMLPNVNQCDLEDHNDYAFARELVYTREPLSDSTINLCEHGKVSWESVCRGLVKAVNRTAAEELLHTYGIGLKAVSNNTEAGDPIMNNGYSPLTSLRTGNDICVECVRQAKNDANFKASLAKCDSLLKNIKQRTHDPNRDLDKTGPEIPPSPNDVWVSEKHLRNFKKLANGQREHAKQLSLKNQNVLHFSINVNGFQKTVRSSARNSTNHIIHDNASSPARASPEKERVAGPSSENQNDLNGDAMEEGGEEDYIADEAPQKFNEDLLCEHGNLTYTVKRVWLTKEEWDQLKKGFVNFVEAFPVSEDECVQCTQKFINAQYEKNVCKNVLDAINSNILKLVRQIERRKTWEAEQLGIMYDKILCANFARKVIKNAKSKVNVEIPRICQDCIICQHGNPYLFPDPHNENCLAIPVTSEEWNQIVEAYTRTVPEYGTAHVIKLTEQGQPEDFCEDCFAEYSMVENSKRCEYTNGADIYVKLQEDVNGEQVVKAAPSAMTTRRLATKLASKNVYKFRMSSDDRVVDLKLKIYDRIQQTPSDQLLYWDGNVLDNETTLGSVRVPANNAEQPLILIVQQRIDTLSGETRKLEKGFEGSTLLNNHPILPSQFD
ncbi:ubiquitin carboxyl-terminal hydrolase domain-containing protein [Ditylenchus destructor]|uniref:ubiquitinyl hydrolase 1 n=1 Tax=Ditylenchus destructor TaxID=166010 RepID=A0AAD4NA95_9BILA|nr:ubiquitin carboxyl-terminal hydrolase domain-containing protein [Ditylenchus destructor]